ncbi:hypothetical protein BS50DRAFT_588582 [Corynespora cassiicola Philippines]|uniref:Uncharacterized protein n=1 Tax=Corynespora cassiicola Philippines TaxID=1448308 RepID=A0A2T2NK08_CORCC|nr:hypothetical protein BS50DRAFT_588582 [Corynespora cassiicola Philippines]
MGPHIATKAVSLFRYLSSLPKVTLRGWVVPFLIYDLTLIFAFMNKACVREVKEVLTLKLLGIKEWLDHPLSVVCDPRNQLVYSILGGLLAAIVKRQPKVPKIRITGLGRCAADMQQKFEAITRADLRDNGSTRQQCSIAAFALYWPFPHRFAGLWMEHNGVRQMLRIRASAENLTTALTVNQWGGLVWESLEKTYNWELAE